MTSILIRNVDETLHARLKARAAAHRRSLEDEIKELLRGAAARQEAPARENLATLALRLFGPEHGLMGLRQLPPATLRTLPIAAFR